jgi:hypothetical protein
VITNWLTYWLSANGNVLTLADVNVLDKQLRKLRNKLAHEVVDPKDVAEAITTIEAGAIRTIASKFYFALYGRTPEDDVFV